MSTIVKDEDNYIRQDKFRHNLGISRFIIYNNSKKDTILYIIRLYK